MKINFLADSYLADAHSGFQMVRHVTKVSYRRHLMRLRAQLGETDIAELKARKLLELYDGWTQNHGLSMAHSLIAQLRIVSRFGATLLENEDCQKLSGLLSGMRFKNAKPRETWMEAHHAAAICASAALAGHDGVALGHAIQYACALRQKDVIGERVPLNEPVEAIVIEADWKWVRGLVAEEISADLILTHKTSKRGQVLEFPLKSSELIMKYLHLAPTSGPLIIHPYTQRPFYPWQWRRMWRHHADKVGVPKGVWNMDARAGRATELLANGVLLEDARKFMGHEQSTTTSRYSRGTPEAIARAFTVVNSKAS